MPSSRYQSQMLQTIAQQSMRLRDRALKSLRQIKLALTWSAQIVLYPIYVALQSSRLVGRQIDQAAQRLFPRLTASLDPQPTPTDFSSQTPSLPTSDRPFQALLPALEGLILYPSTSSPLQPAPSALQLPPSAQAAPHRTIQSPEFRAIACLIPGQNLVLVDSNNRIQDVLSLEQQHELQRLIVAEVAAYWRDRRRYVASQTQQALGGRFLPIPQTRSTMLPPVRYLRQFIAWMQTSPLAIATNLFHESALVPSPLMLNPMTQSGRVIGADLPLELWFDPDYHGSTEGWFDANQLNQVRRHREFPPVVPSLPARIATTTLPDTNYTKLDAESREMVGEDWLKSPTSRTITAMDMDTTPTFPESATALFKAEAEKAEQGDISSSLTHYLAHHGAAYDFRQIENPGVDREMLYPVPQTPINQSTAAQTPAPALDTTAELVEYEQHPLERLLGWIDMGLTWIELRLTRMWAWMRDRC